MAEWFVIDTRTDQIVNCITCSDEPSLDGFNAAEYLRLDRNPPMEKLSRYRYWNERP